jgi:peroxiredoxin
MNNHKKIVIEIDNLTEAQIIAINDMLATWQWLGGVGSSRWTSFYADGDGDFRPKILVDGKQPDTTPLLQRSEVWNENQEYRIDFDIISQKINNIHDKEVR